MEGPGELAWAGRAAGERFGRDYDADVVPQLLRFLRAPPSAEHSSSAEPTRAGYHWGRQARALGGVAGEWRRWTWWRSDSRLLPVTKARPRRIPPTTSVSQ